MICVSTDIILEWLSGAVRSIWRLDTSIHYLKRRESNYVLKQFHEVLHRADGVVRVQKNCGGKSSRVQHVVVFRVPLLRVGFEHTHMR